MPYYGIDPEKYRIRGKNYGQSNGGQGTQKRYYPACQNKCGPILHYMLQGLNVAF